MKSIFIWNNCPWKMEIITCLKKDTKSLQNSIISSEVTAAKVVADIALMAMTGKRIPIKYRSIRHDI